MKNNHDLLSGNLCAIAERNHCAVSSPSIEESVVSAFKVPEQLLARGHPESVLEPICCLQNDSLGVFVPSTLYAW